MANGSSYALAIKISGKVDQSLQTSAKKAQGIIGSIVKANLITAGIQKAGGAVASFVSGAVESYTGFEQSLANASAIAGASGEAFDQMKNAAIEAGKSTQFTAAQAADALGYMSLAGWDVKTSTEALQPVLKLAQATGADLATTSDLVTDSMSAMGVGVEDLQGYLDTLVTTNNKANTTAAQLMDAMKGAGPAATSAGMSYKQTATALGILANNGVKGAEAGTALNSMIMRMTSKKDALDMYEKLGVSVFDADGKMRNFEDILGETDKALSKLSDEDRSAAIAKMAGVNYAGQFQFLLKGVREGVGGAASEWDKLNGAINDGSGALDTMNEKTTATIKGSMARLSSAFDGARIAFMDKFAPQIAGTLDWLATNIMPKLEKAVTFVADALIAMGTAVSNVINYIRECGGVVGVLTNFYNEHKTAIDLVAIVVGTLTAALIAYNASAIWSATVQAALTVATGAWSIAAGIAATVTWAFGAAVAFLTSPIVLVILAIGAIIAIIYLLIKYWDDVAAAAKWCWDAIVSAVTWCWDKFVEFIAWVWDGLVGGLSAVWDAIVGACSAAWDAVVGGLTGAWEAFKSFLAWIWDGLVGGIKSAFEGITSVAKAVFGGLVGIVKAPFNGIISLVNMVIDAINGISIEIPDWVPLMGGKTLGFSIPQIPMLAEGGVATKPTLAMIGEGSENEAVLPLSKLEGMMGGSGGAPITFAPVINLNGGNGEGIKGALDEAFVQFKQMMAQYERDRQRKAFGY